MIFSNKKLTVEDIKKDKEIMDVLTTEIKASLIPEKNDVDNAKLVELQTALLEANKKLAEFENNKNITSYASKLGLEVEPYLNKPFNVVIKNMVDEHLKIHKDVRDSFKDTASEAVGTPPVSNGTSDEITTFHEAMVFIQKRDKISMLEAVKKAQVEFKSLFNKMYSEMPDEPDEPEEPEDIDETDETDEK